MHKAAQWSPFCFLPFMNRSHIIANAFFLYVRMLVVMVVQIFTVRIVLQTLGQADFGLFYTVAGVVSFLSFLTSTMSSATSRFIAYEIGKQEDSDIQKVFSTAWCIHVGIAALVLLLAETLGVWFLNHQLDIPQGRLLAANVLLQITILISLLSILQVPFTASVMAHERMNVFAVIEVLAVFLKLAILFMIPLLPYDNLIVYGALLLIISLIIFLLYVIYCNRHLGNCRMRLSYDSQALLDMFSFSGLDLFGNLSVAARTQGVIVLFNIFFGVIMVSAASIAMNVQNAIMSFAGNVLTAFRPQIVKSYASSEYGTVDRLVGSAGIYTSLLLLVVTIPLILNIDFVLEKWLGDVPAYTADFCRLTLIFNLFANLSSVVIAAIHANGNIMRPSFINGTLYLLVIPISLFLFKFGYAPIYAYTYNIVAVVLGMLSNVWTLHLLMPQFQVRRFLVQVVKTLLVGAFSYGAVYYISQGMDASWLRLGLTTVSAAVLILLLALAFLLEKEEVAAIRAKIARYV